MQCATSIDFFHSLFAPLSVCPAERDFHKMHHQRVVQEKNRLVADIKRLKKQYEV